MSVIPEQYLDRLRAAGLLVSEPFVHNHVAYPDGVIIGKPASLRGHSIPGYECWWGGDGGCDLGAMLDAPGLRFHSDGGKWFVTAHECIPGPGPGDFVNEWGTADEAVADILDFYFGGAARMDAYRQAMGR